MAKQPPASALNSNNSSPCDTAASRPTAYGSLQESTTSLDVKKASIPPKPDAPKEKPGGGCNEKLCSTCDAPVKEEWMDRCKRCYALRPKCSEVTSASKGPGKCRLCTGATGQDWKEYCHKCYTAKQRDDAQRRRTTAPVAAAAAVANKPFVSYTCMECGGHCSECWMRRCRVCYEKTPDCKRPRLVSKKKA